MRRRLCVVCDSPTKRIKRRRKRDTLPPPLYDHHMLKRRGDDLWRVLIYAKSEEMRCVVPWPTHSAGIQAMHYISRRKLATRHDPDNGAPGCGSCHMRLTRDQEAHEKFFRAYLGEAKCERLRLRAMARSKTDLGITIMYLEAQLLEKGLTVPA